jgi:hypothetical protein
MTGVAWNKLNVAAADAAERYTTFTNARATISASQASSGSTPVGATEVATLFRGN